MIHKKRYSKNWRSKIVIFVTLGGTALFLFLGYREPKVTISPANFNVQAPWGITLPMVEIASVDTIVWNDMPPIALRTNGFSLFGVNRGSFRTRDGNNVRLNLKCGANPVIRISDKNGRIYYVNRRKPEETKDIFITLTNYLKYTN